VRLSTNSPRVVSAVCSLHWFQCHNTSAACLCEWQMWSYISYWISR